MTERSEAEKIRMDCDHNSAFVRSVEKQVKPYSLPAFMTLQLCKGNVTVFMAIRLNRLLIMYNLSTKRSWQPIRERTASI